jgi:hypothetical protein
MINLTIDPGDLLLIVLQVFKQILNAAPQYRVPELGIYITDGLQHKTSFVHARMGKFKISAFYNLLVIENEIEIKGTGTEANFFHPLTARGLDGIGNGEQVMGHQGRLDAKSRIHEPVLIGVIDRRRAIKG